MNSGVVLDEFLEQARQDQRLKVIRLKKISENAWLKVSQGLTIAEMQSALSKAVSRIKKSVKTTILMMLAEKNRLFESQEY